jgi:hypothetical protein
VAVPNDRWQPAATASYEASAPFCPWGSKRSSARGALARALLITGLCDIPLMLVHIGQAVERLHNEQKLRRVDRVAAVNGNELEMIDDRQRGSSGSSASAVAASIPWPSSTVEITAAVSGPKPQGAVVSIYTHRRRGRVCQ